MRNLRLGPLLAFLFFLLSLVVLPWPAIIPALVVGLLIAIVSRLGFEQWRVWTRAHWINPAILLVLLVIAWQNGWPMDGANGWLVVSAPLWCVLIWRSYRWAWRSMIGERIEAGEGSASTLNRVLPAMLNGRWADAGARLGWKLQPTAEKWQAAPELAVPLTERLVAKANSVEVVPPPRPFAVAVDLAETRPYWLRPTITKLPGTPEWPATGLVKAEKSTGKWLLPVPARQSIYGASGHGKSVLLREYGLHMLAQGARLLVIDGKGAFGDAEALFSMAAQRGLAVADSERRWWRPDGGNAFSLMRGLDPKQQLDVIRAMRQAQVGDERVTAHFENNAVKGWSLALEQYARENAGADLMSLAGVRDVLTSIRLPAEIAAEMERVIDGKSGTTVAEVATDTLDHVTRSLLGNWQSESEVGWSPVPGPGLDAWRLAVVSAPAASEAGRAAVAGILHRLSIEAFRATDTAATREPLVIVVDEAASVFKSPMARAAIETLLAQGRSAGYSVTLAFQDPGQLDAAGEGGEHFRKMVETNSELVWLGRVSGSARVLELGGNRFGNEATRPGLGSSGSTSVRAQSGYGISPMVIEQLPDWAWGVYSRGRWTGVLVPPT